MKKYIKKWLGIKEIDLNYDIDFLNLIKRVTALENQKDSWQEQENVRNSRICIQLITQILDYLDLDYKKDLVQDPSRLREPEPMIESYTVIKRKKIKQS